MKKKNSLLLMGLCVCLLGMTQEGTVDVNQVRKLIIAESAISNLYVDKVNEEKVVEAGIRAMLKELDPHSTYATAEEVRKLNEPLQGNFDGIGIQFNVSEDTLLVIQPVSNGPSERVGILAGDRIVTVNDTSIAGVKMDRNDMMKRLRGPKGTQVKLGVKRKGIPDLLTFIVVRDKIPVYTLDAAYLIAPKVGYVRISSFGVTTHEEVMKAMEKLTKQGMKDLILDLQGNGGGYLNAAVELGNEFLESGQVIVYTEGMRSPRYDFNAEGEGRFRGGRLVVLVDEYSASAAEIVTGAIQDWDRGVVVGRRSFGKGLVQRPINLPDESMIRLTVARYYTPAGRCIQKPYTDTKEYQMDMINRYNKGELSNKDSIHFPDSLRYQTKRLQRTVYGGGGIMPDYFVPIDTVSYTKYHRELVAKSVIVNTNMYYIDHYRNKLKEQYKTFEQFNKKFEVNKEMLDILLKKAEEAGVKYDEKVYKESLPLIKLQLKALVARDLWDMSEFYQIMNASNESVQKGLEVIQSKEYDQLLNRK